MVYDQVGLAKLTHICWLGLRKHPIIVIHLRTPVALGAHWGGFVVPCVVQILVLGSWPRTFISIAWLLLLPFSRILSWNCQNPKVYYYGTKSFHRNYTILKGPLSPSPSKLWLIAGHSPPGWLMLLSPAQAQDNTPACQDCRQSQLLGSHRLWANTMALTLPSVKPN